MAQGISSVTEAELRLGISLNTELVDMVERGFVALAQGQVTGAEPVSEAFTDLQAAAAGAVAAKYLAPKDVRVAGVIGTGVQARLQMRAAHLVRPFERLLVFGRNLQKAARCAVDLSEALGIDCEVTTDPADLVAQSQLVVTATSARAPVLKAEWLHKNLHITAIGADQAGKTEIDPRALVAASLYVTDRASQCAVLGELEAALAAGLWPDDTPPLELGDVIIGKVEGRQDAADITICDLTGAGHRIRG
ncbi:hypothetical protein [Lentibacter sp.]|uniref:hypothetical protein n=1 Tax=Lentibacter sp. TaxID=2024994 RepID=UPI003F69EF9B